MGHEVGRPMVCRYANARSCSFGDEIYKSILEIIFTKSKFLIPSSKSFLGNFFQIPNTDIVPRNSVKCHMLSILSI
jgi:hypothetical protein